MVGSNLGVVFMCETWIEKHASYSSYPIEYLTNMCLVGWSAPLLVFIMFKESSRGVGIPSFNEMKGLHLTFGGIHGWGTSYFWVSNGKKKPF